MSSAAKKEGVDLEITQAPIVDAESMNVFLEECANDPPDGVIVSVMSLNAGWEETNRFVAKRPKEIPTIVFSPMGTSFTGHLQATRNQPKTLVAATQDIEWLAEGVHLLKTIVDMKTTRLLIVNGDKTIEYYYGTRVESDWTEAGAIRYLAPDGSVVADGFLVAIDPPRKLELMFHARWDAELAEEGPVRMVWLIGEANGLTTVTVESYLDPKTKTYNNFREGIPYIVAGMKTLLETGGPLASD